jgi:ribosomal protein S18 acetylase RimI-like enzyme
MRNEDAPIGFVTSVHNGSEMLIWQYGILKEYRQLGLSDQLIASVANFGISNGYKEAYISIDGNNEPSNAALSHFCKKRGLQLETAGTIQLLDHVDPSLAENEILFRIIF